MFSTNILLEEWFGICEQFLQGKQSQHDWNEELCLYMMWYQFLATKYLNSTLIEKFIEILPKLKYESKYGICSTLSSNPALTIIL